MLVATGKAPFTGDAIAAFTDYHSRLGIVRTRGQHRTTITDDGTGDLWNDICRGHREARTLANAPCDTGIALRERLKHLKKGCGLDLLTIIGTRDEQAEQPRVMQRIEHV